MRKEDFKVGYVVEHRNGELAMVMFADDEMLCINKNRGYGLLSDHDEYLRCGYTDDNGKYEPLEDYDIVKVYGYTSSRFGALDITTNQRPLLWDEEREELLNDIAELKRIIAKGEEFTRQGYGSDAFNQINKMFLASLEKRLEDAK